MGSSKKKPYSIPRRLFGNSKGEGVAKAKVLKEKSLPKKATFMRISWWVRVFTANCGPYKNIYFWVSCVLGQIIKRKAVFFYRDSMTVKHQVLREFVCWFKSSWIHWFLGTTKWSAWCYVWEKSATWRSCYRSRRWWRQLLCYRQVCVAFCGLWLEGATCNCHGCHSLKKLDQIFQVYQ